MRVNRRHRGFTLIELLVTLSLVGLLSLVAWPLAEIMSTRQKESELRYALRTIRVALDAYKAASDAGDIERETGASGYPPDLETLVKGITVKQRVVNSVPAADSAPVAGTAGGSGMAATSAGQPAALPRRLYFLRSVPRDPFADEALPASQTWALRSYASRPDSPQPGADVFDIASRVTRRGLNGTPYNTW